MDINMLFVTKRDGHKESVQFDKITERISRLINKDENDELYDFIMDNDNIDPIQILYLVSIEIIYHTYKV